jgi:hypothetical protein
LVEGLEVAGSDDEAPMYVVVEAECAAEALDGVRR